MGLGTASSEMMDILGIGSSEKDIVVSLGRQTAVEGVVREFIDNLSTVRRGRGIMMLFTPNAVGNLIATMLAGGNTEEDAARAAEKEGAELMQNEHKHSLILIAVNQGYSEVVMVAARHAGATGGTVIRARLAGDALAESFKGFALQSEKEIIAILAPDTIKEKVMTAVNAGFGMKTEAQGVLCSLPVDKAFKI